MSGKRIAVLLSAYNGERYIEKQIESILHQEGVDPPTIIIRNDGSRDNTMQILEKLQRENENVEVIDGSNIGLAASFLELLDYAYNRDYDYYSFSDQDDYWLPEKLCTALHALGGHEEPCLYSACSKVVDENLVESGAVTQTKLRDITFYNSAIQNFCPGHNQVLNRAMAGIIVSKTKYSSAIYSQDMWITTAASVTGSILFDNTPHTLYRQHADNQLHFGKSRAEWSKDHIKRLMNKEGKRIALQLQFFSESYNEYLNKEQKQEIRDFFDSQASIFKRIHYAAHTKMYRQRAYETTLFKMLYVFGGYNIP